MGLIKAIKGAAGGVMADQWKEYIYCNAMDADVLAARGQKKVSGKSSNTKGADNVISNGSVIAINEGQCMMIVEQGKVVDVCAEPGEYTYDMSSEPSLFCGNLSESIGEIFSNIGKRFTFGGEAPKDQRVYYFNTKELVGNKYGTPNPIPFRVVDYNIGLDMDISIRCFGEYSYRITNPILFYTNVCGNVDYIFTRDKIDMQLKSELLTALQPAFARISGMGIRYSALPGHTQELAQALNEVLSAKWSNLRGIEIVSVGVSSVKALDEDEAMIKELQRNAVFRNPNMAAAHLTGAQASAMQAAASNPNAGPAMAFMGMGMAGNMGGANAQNLYTMGQQPQYQQPMQNQYQQPQYQQPMQNQYQQPQYQQPMQNQYQQPTQPASAAGSGAAAQDGWVCAACGTVNKGKFCMECGAKKPAGALQYRCDKCGWQPADPTKPPKFCPECGDPFDAGDICS